MPLADLTSLLESVQSSRHGLGCFAAHSLEFIWSIAAAADAERSPVVISINAHSFIGLRELEVLAAASTRAAEDAEMPMAVHLNHCRDLNLLREVIHYGFTSIMFDGSFLPYDQNVSATRKAVAIARKVGVSVEGEVRLADAGQQPDEMRLALEDGVQLAWETGVDCLAASIGDGHGMMQCDGTLDMRTIEALASQTGLPLALHGGSGITQEDLRQAISLGIGKVNISREMQVAFHRGLQQALQPSLQTSTREVLTAGYREVLACAREKVRQLRSF